MVGACPARVRHNCDTYWHNRAHVWHNMAHSGTCLPDSGTFWHISAHLNCNFSSFPRQSGTFLAHLPFHMTCSGTIWHILAHGRCRRCTWVPPLRADGCPAARGEAAQCCTSGCSSSFCSSSSAAWQGDRNYHVCRCGYLTIGCRDLTIGCRDLTIGCRDLLLCRDRDHTPLPPEPPA